MESRTDFLFARPSFWSGMASTLDLGGTLFQFNESESGEQADTIALRMDWSVVGDDLRRAMRQIAAEAGVSIERRETAVR